jgi:hypothetical protein
MTCCRDVIAEPRHPHQQPFLLEELHRFAAGLARVSEFLAERGFRRYGATRCKLTVQDLVPQARRQPDIRPRVSQITTTSDTITVRLERRAYLPVLRKGSLPADTRVPW